MQVVGPVCCPGCRLDALQEGAHNGKDMDDKI